MFQIDKFLLLILGFYYCHGNSQSSTIVSYNSSMLGKSANICLVKESSKSEYTIGVKYHFNAPYHPDNQNNVYYKRFYASNFAQHFGLVFQYSRLLNHKENAISPYIFYNTQVSRGIANNKIVHPTSYTSNMEELYIKYESEQFGPYFWVEQYIGLGYKADISNTFYIRQNFGIGVTLILGYEERILPNNGWSYEFAALVDFGIGYKF